MKKFRLTYTRVIALGFAAVIIIGAIMLCLPVSSRSGCWTSPIDALFTASSATCVTGLVVYDTYTHWSLFGQLVILTMIQVGGLGLMTMISLILVMTKKKISLFERKLFVQSSGSLKMSGLHSQLRHIIGGTLLCEGAGTVALATQFCPEMGFWEGLYNSVFHSVSAFCNAGFDLMGKKAPFSSLTSYTDNIVVNITIMSLIVTGGIGFLVWEDITRQRFRFNKFQLHTKIVLVVTCTLLVSGWALFFVFERNRLLVGEPLWLQLMQSLFQSVTTRTAGFNTIDMSRLSPPSTLLSIVLMVIGGSPGSTAGGMKTTTLAVIVIGAVSLVRNRSNLEAFKRRLEDGAYRIATAIASTYFILLIAFTLVICAIEPFGIDNVLFELSSAIGTVGLSKGITPLLGTASRLLVALLMYAGRLGGLSLVLIFAEKRDYVPLDRPVEKILLG